MIGGEGGEGEGEGKISPMCESIGHRPLRGRCPKTCITVIFQPIWLKLGMESLNGWTQHMYVIYMHLSMLTGQTNLPPNQPNGLKVKNLHNFDIFQPIWLKLGMESLYERTQHMCVIYNDFIMLTSQTGLLPNQPAT